VENGLFSSADFTQWSKNYVLYLHISTRIEGRKHEGLFRAKGFTGFPTLAFLDVEGGLTAKHAGSRVVGAIQKTADKSMAYMALRDKAASGDKVAVQHLFVADLELARYDFTLGSLKLAGLRKEMSESLQKKADQLMIDIQYNELRRRLSKELSAGLGRKEYTRRYQGLNLDFYRSGLFPSGRTAVSILMGVMGYASKNKDEALLAQALEKFKAQASNQPGFAPRVARYESMLARLRRDK
jgi:hypothetical protein